MQNPFQSGSDAQSATHDPLSFIKKLWGDMQLPGMVTPTISVDELDKQIRDLKTVESWLTVNMNMLRGTIQALEVQRATITALKAMGESFAQTAAAAGTSKSSSADQNHAGWPMHQANDKVSEAQADAENQLDEDEGEDDSTPEVEVSEQKTQEPDASNTNTNTDPATAYSTPAAWWNVLQDQFKQALGNALKDDDEVKSANSAGSTSKKKVEAKPRKTSTKIAEKSSKAASLSKASANKTNTTEPRTAKPSVNAKKAIAPKATARKSTRSVSKA